MIRKLVLLAALLPTGVLAGPPPQLADLYDAEPSGRAAFSIPEESRRGAMRSAAIGFASRSALHRRNWEHGQLLETYGTELSRIYRFRALLIHHGGFTLMPPVAVRTRNAFRLARSGHQAASAERVFRILEPEKLVSAPPHWRDFLVRSWPEPEPPVSVLFPRNPVESALWRKWLEEGWAHGTRLADDIFAADLDRLNRTFIGLVTWRRARIAHMATEPRIQIRHNSVAGGGKTLRINDRNARIAIRSRLDPDSRNWRTP